MNTQTINRYYETTEIIWTEAESRKTALHDLTKYIDKMTMLGSRFKTVDQEIQSALWTRRHDGHMDDFEEYCKTELAALTYMASKITARAIHNKLICRAIEKGDLEMATFRKEFERTALRVKEVEVVAKDDFRKLSRFRRRECMLA